MSNIVKTKSGRTFILPTPEEEAEIQRGIDADPDAYALTDEEMAEMNPHAEFMAKRGRGRPRLDTTKEQVSVRYDADILAAFRATGEGWQTRMNDALRTYLVEHPIRDAHES